MAMKKFDEKIIVSKGKRGTQAARFVRFDEKKGMALYVADDGDMCWVFQHPSTNNQNMEV